MNLHDKRTPLSVTTGPIGESRKVYSSPAGRPDIRVPYREIPLDPSSGEPPLRVYDPSGPYSCENFTPDLSAGLPAARPWLATRAGSRPTQGRAVKPEDNGFRRRRPARPALPGRAQALSRRRRRRPSRSSNSRAPGSSRKR